MLRFLENSGDYFSQNFFGEDFPKKVFTKSGYTPEHIKEYNSKIGSLREKYFQFKNDYLGLKRTKDQVLRGYEFHTLLLESLGYDEKDDYSQPVHLNEKEVVPVRKRINKGDKPFLYIMEMVPMIKQGDDEVLGIFEQVYQMNDWEKVLGFKENGISIKPDVINEALSELFLLDQSQRPEYVIMLAGPKVFLIHYEKWLKGSYLLFDLEELFTETQIAANRNYLALFYALLSRKQFINDTEALLKSLDEDSHKAAYAVTSSLKNGVIYAVEALANEAIHYKKQQAKSTEDLQYLEELMASPDFARELKDECLTVVYRLLFLFYAEAREDLEILPVNDEVYLKGYSLEMLRELEMVPLISDSARNGYFFSESLWKLFDFLYQGVKRKDNQNSFILRPLDSPLFDNSALIHLNQAKFRNAVLQEIIVRLSLSEKTRKKGRGRISYANLGINQLGSVYESLLAFSGYFASEDLIEVKRANDPDGKEGTFLVPRRRRDDFEESEILKFKRTSDSEEEDVIIEKGTFVYRLNGRDRQKSASYYTPEVLTECTVKYTLKNILEKLRERQEKGEKCADEILQLKLLEPAMGAAAFHNEVINQLSVAYLELKENEAVASGEKRIPPGDYSDELQKVKAYLAANNVYGVDINPTAVELGKLSLWLNAMHKNMETPFFAHRLGTGNAVVGAWLKVYKEEEVLIKYTNQTGTRWEKKEWWEKAPKRVIWNKSGQLNRKENEIYHFLLPDKNMLASAGIRILKSENEEATNKIRDWKKEFVKPLRKAEVNRLKQFSKAIDLLLEEHYRQTSSINQQTASHYSLYGQTGQLEAELDYHKKEMLANKRQAETAAFFKLKTIMDYWCALWFWDMRKADLIPTRQQWYDEVDQILNLDLEQLTKLYEKAIAEPSGFESPLGEQASIFSEPKQMTFGGGSKRRKDETKVLSAIAKGTTGTAIFQENRIQLVQSLAQANRFFHYELEFVEVFKERGGFDITIGNPPWVPILFDEGGVLSELNPEIIIRKFSAPEISNFARNILNQNERFKSDYLREFIDTEALQTFITSSQNYPLLFSQRNNLYKCILTNSFGLTNSLGYIGLLHPEGVYEDPSADSLRAVLYKRLEYHFGFKNALFLFSEVHDQQNFSVNIYGSETDKIDFFSLHNLFHPSTIDGSFSNVNSTSEGLKVFDEAKKKYVWNVAPSSSRIIRITEEELKLISESFESTTSISPKLPSFFTSEVFNVLIKAGNFKYKFRDSPTYTTMCWDEVGAVKRGFIKPAVGFAENYENYIFKGPHFFVCNPFYQTPRSVCKQNSHYDSINIVGVETNFIPRTNFIKGDKFELNSDEAFSKWYDSYKICFSRRLNIASERTLQCAIFPPKSTHVNSVISCSLDKKKSLDFVSLSSSIVVDAYVKAIGRGDIYSFDVLPNKIHDSLTVYSDLRVLRLNCLNKYYESLWSEKWTSDYLIDEWSLEDSRLSPNYDLKEVWNHKSRLNNPFERRLALVEIDVMSAMSLGISLDELISTYKVQFPVLKENEDDTWYDQKGNIVFTCSKGLTGVGLDRGDWNQIKDMKSGTYEHTIDPKKSELYGGQQVTYYAPFDKCDRVEDYKRAWKHFEERFKAE